MKNKENSRTIEHKNYIIYLDEMLGKGEYGTVYLCQNTENLEHLAAKIFDEVTQQTLNECKNLKSLRNSEHVLRFVDYFLYESKCILITEYCERTLDSFVKENGGRLTEKLSSSIFIQMLKGMKSLHEIGLMHRDIKIENIYLKDNIVKIGEFGFSTSKYVTNSVIGTPMNMNPQLLNKTIDG